jgi:hypothetical protein
MGFGTRKPGEHALLREVWQGKVWSVRPVTVVQDSSEFVALYIAHGVKCLWARTPGGRVLRVPWEPWKLSRPLPWINHGLRLYFPGEPYSLSLTWDTDWRVLSWYVNAEEPLRPGPLGFDYMDWTLDIVIEPDLSAHTWKDEEELEMAVTRGVYTSEHAQEIRRAAERGRERLLQRAPPLDEPWEDWRPDPEWTLPALPERWE